METVMFATIGAICGVLMYVLIMRAKGIRFGEWYWYCPGDGSVRRASYWANLSGMAVVGSMSGLFAWLMSHLNLF